MPARTSLIHLTGGGARVGGALAVAAADQQPVQARIVNGDAYIEEHLIDRVDLMKIDVEGAERSVLEGLRRSFGQRKIGMVQIEYNWINAQTRFLLKDIYDFFEAYDFAIGKIYPEGVLFKEYAFEDEDFIGMNYFACPRSRQDVIDAVRCPVVHDVRSTTFRAAYGRRSERALAASSWISASAGGM